MAVTIIDKGIQIAGSSGRVIAFMAVKIRDPDTGKSVGPNQLGEICVKGPLVMLGYYNDEKATKETFTSDGWLKTGDLAYYDDEKYFYVVDRLKELIKYKGFQVIITALHFLLNKTFIFIMIISQTFIISGQLFFKLTNIPIVYPL